MSSLLPSNRTLFEEALEATVSRSLPNEIVTVWHPDDCPAKYLNYLAWGLSIDIWDDAWTEANKREVLRNALFVHKHKGTLSAVKTAVRSAGLGETTVTENTASPLYRNGTLNRDGGVERGEGTTNKWAIYSITINAALTQEQSAAVNKLVSAAAPARCHLAELYFTANAILRNGTVLRDGQFTRGSL